jgi:hypothetical protein
MPIHRAFDPKDRVLRTTISGCLTFDEIEEHLNAVRRTGAEACPELVDARLADSRCVSHQTLLFVATRARYLLGSRRFVRRAVVVSSDTHFAQARRFAAFVAGWLRIGVFDCPDAARDWLLEPVSIPGVISKSAVAAWERPAQPAP